MAKNWIQKGSTIPFVGAATSGAVVIIGALAGVADRTTQAGESNELHLDEVFELPKGNFGLNMGDYYSVNTVADNANVNTTGANIKNIGVVIRDTDVSEAVVAVKLIGRALETA